MKLTKPEEITVRIRRLGMRQSAFAESVEIPPSTFSLMLNGHEPLPKEAIRKIEKKLSRLERLMG